MKIKYILSIKSTEFAKCDAFYMNNSGFVKLIKLYLYPYLQYGFADSLLAGRHDSQNTWETVSPTHKLSGKGLTVGVGLNCRRRVNCRQRI
jgi:hypothetical protein